MSYLYNEEIINEVRDKSDIVDTISKYINLKRFGSNYKGLCPFHGEKTPSFTVSEEKQIFHCFGCGEGGDVISFLMRYENLEFVDALKILADNAHITLEKKNINPKLEKTKEILYEINREAGIYFFRNLFKDKKAYTYLMDRGIDSATLKTFGVGYALPGWNNLLDYLKSKDYSEEDIEKAGLITHHKKSGRYFDKFRGRIMFPIISTRGSVIGFGARSIDDENQPKYLNSPETPVFSKGNNLYALNVVKKHNKSEKVILVEGYMDVLSLYKYGIVNSVASLGTALTQNQVQLLKRYSKEIYICYDSDNAGRNATNKAIDVMKTMDIKPKIILLPEKLDPDDFIKEYGLEKFKDLLENSLTSMDFKIRQKKSSYDINKYEDKIDFVKDVSILLREIESPVELEVYIEKISNETNIPVQVIKQEVNKNLIQKDKYTIKKYSDKYSMNNKENIEPVKYMLKPGHITAEKELLNLIITDKAIYERVKDIFKAEDFLDSLYRRLAKSVYESYEKNEEIDSIGLIGQFEEAEQERVRDIFILKINISEDINVVEDYIKSINYHKINLKKEDIKKQINTIDNKKDKTKEDLELFNTLCLELIKIDQGLKIN